METDSYCREIEAHLCRKNAGHLVRVAGPAFEMVAGWAAKGIPVKVALRGIDRTVERREAKGPGRRPLRVEFCEADVLDAFDEWRRAVGVGTAGGGAPASPSQSLRAHLDRVVTRLTDCVASGALAGELESVVEKLIVELGEARTASRSVRGGARAALIARLTAIDDELLASARATTPGDIMAALRLEAGEELVAFRGRMPAGEYARAVEAATTNLLRACLKLPGVAYEQG